jgi:uncharacterized protein (DUF1800 family)
MYALTDSGTRLCKGWLMLRKFWCFLPWVLLELLAACSGSNSSAPNSSGPSAPNPGASAPSPTTGGTPPPSTAQPMGTAAAARLLMQATMGASLTDLTHAAAQTYDAWFAAQAAAKPSLELTQVVAPLDSRLPAWWYNAVNGSDQLRQRMAFALSEIIVVSDVNSVLVRDQNLAYYYDQFSSNALGNFRKLLGVVSVSPEMGKYLTFYKNDVANPALGVHADENYAREIMQLFTIGLWRLNPDGTEELDKNGNPIPTFTQSDVTNLANVFTGWGSHPGGTDSGEPDWNSDNDFMDPMACYPAHHDASAKTIVGSVQIPAGGSCESDMAAALDTLFNHPNTGPFVSKQLIQRLVTSNPSPQYVGRIAAAFANNGQGVRGDLLAVAKAILTDPEAVAIGTAAGAGKLREPVLRLTALWRAFSAAQSNGAVTDTITWLASRAFGENSLKSPSVFNFFTPTYRRAGPLAAAGLVVPEFQITNESTIISTANSLQWQAYKFVPGNGAAKVGWGGSSAPGPADMVLHTAAWEGYAADAGALIDHLELVFMPGQMPATMRGMLVSYVNAIPVTSPANRVIEAASLLLNSSQYSIQR